MDFVSLLVRTSLKNLMLSVDAKNDLSASIHRRLCSRSFERSLGLAGTKHRAEPAPSSLTKPKSRAPADDVNDDRMPVDGCYAVRLGGPDTVPVKWSTECTSDSVKWLTADSPRVVVDESSIEAVPPSALTKHANFMLIATPDKRPYVQKRHLSVQVLNEFVAVTRRKLDKSWEEVRRALDVLRVFCPEPVPLTVETHERAVHIAERYGYSIFDSLIIAAALHAGASTLYTEDMRDGQAIDGLTIRNPFSR
jgi:predicted nucleic acid-binding protein